MKKLISLLLLIFFVAIFLIVNSTIGSNSQSKFKWIKEYFPNKYKTVITKYIFPYKALENEKNKLKKFQEKYANDIAFYVDTFNENESSENKIILNQDFIIKNNLLDLIYEKNLKNIKKDLDVKIFSIKKNKFLRGVKLVKPGSAYLEFYKNNIFIISTIGILGFSDIEKDKFHFKQIKNNINSFLQFEHLEKDRRIGIKDIKIFNETIFLSYVNETSKDCWNVAILKAKLNFKELFFEKFFEPKDCVNEFDPEFNNSNEVITFSQAGGRIVQFKDDSILLTTGEFRSRSLPQNPNSSFGKILKINLINGKSQLISMGHRNPQGLYYDKDNNYILSSEHGAFGGDEINLIELHKNEIPNFGWAQASYSEHYCGGKTGCFAKSYDKYPLLKSHAENGYVEPLRYFTPSVAPSEIVNLANKIYALATLKDKSIYVFKINDENKIKDIRRIEIGERIRDIAVDNYNRKLYLFLENTNSIGLININSLLNWYQLAK